jgi:hypothetical protein
MPTPSVGSPEEICNLALDAIGFPQAIASIYEGTEAARVALREYAQARDELLRESDWPFARQAVTLTLLKTAPVGGYGLTPWSNAYPPLPWIYEYAYPSDCLDVRSVRPVPIIIPNYQVFPNIFVVASDTATGQKVLLTNLANATAVYTGQVTDMTQWEPLFVSALVDKLARKFAPALKAAGEALKLAVAEEGKSAAEAEAEDG